MNNKKCARCNSLLPLSMFAKDKQQKNGLACYCRVCRSINKGMGNIFVHMSNRKLHESNKYFLKKLFNPNYGSDHYKKYNKYYKRKSAKRERNISWHMKYKNPFACDVEIEWHHINNRDVVAVPKDLHQLYIVRDRKQHRNMLNHIVEQIYRGC